MLQCTVCKKEGNRQWWADRDNALSEALFDKALQTEWQCKKHKICFQCNKAGDDEHTLLCDGCDRACHMHCARPMVIAVPTGDWFCHVCKPVLTDARFHLFLTGVVNGRPLQYNDYFCVGEANDYKSRRDAFVATIVRTMDAAWDDDVVMPARKKIIIISDSEDDDC